MKNNLENLSVRELTENEAFQTNGGGPCMEFLGKVVGGIVSAVQAIQAGAAQGGYAACKVGPIP